MAATKLAARQLIDANLNTAQFETLPDGSIGVRTDYLQSLNLGGSGTANTTPAAPAAGVVDDTANTFGFTLTSGIALSGNYEYTLNGGTTVADVTVNPIVVGDVAKANGQVGVRVKAATGRNASAWLYNTTPFTVAAAAPAGATAPITAWHGISQGTKLDTNSFTFTTSSAAFGYAYADQKIASGVSGWVQFDGIMSPGATDTAYLSLTNTLNSTGGNDVAGFNAWFTGSNKVVSRFSGTWNNDSAWTPATGQNGAITKIRIRVDATTGYLETSIDNGANWVLIASGARPTGDLYVRVVADVSKTGMEIHNLIGNGLS